MLRLASDPQFFARCFRELKLYGDHVGWACLKWLTVSVFKIRNLPLVARSDQKCKKEDLKSMSRLNSRIFIIYYIKIGAKSVQYTLSHCSLIACADRTLGFLTSLNFLVNSCKSFFKWLESLMKTKFCKHFWISDILQPAWRLGLTSEVQKDYLRSARNFFTLLSKILFFNESYSYFFNNQWKFFGWNRGSRTFRYWRTSRMRAWKC